MEEVKNNINNLDELNKENYVELIKVLYDKLNDSTKSQMKKSMKEAQKKYYENHKDKIKEKQHEYIMNNLDVIRERQKKYRERKKEEMKPIIEAKKLEKERIKQEKLKNKRPVGRPRKNKDNNINSDIDIKPRIIKDEENNELIKPEPIKPKRGRPRKY